MGERREKKGDATENRDRIRLISRTTGGVAGRGDVELVSAQRGSVQCVAERGIFGQITIDFQPPSLARGKEGGELQRSWRKNEVLKSAKREKKKKGEDLMKPSYQLP